MEQKPKVTFDGQNGTLVIEGELLPDSPVVHHMLAALLDEEDPAKATVETSIVNDVISYKVTFSHTKDVVAAGKAAHDLAVEAANCVPPITVAELVERKAAAAKAKADAEAAAKKAAAAAKAKE